MKEKYLIAAVMVSTFVLLSASGNAIVVKEECLNDTHQYSSYNYTELENDRLTHYNFEQVTECINGCSDTLGKCRWDSFYLYIYGFSVILGLIFMGIVGIKYAGYYSPIVLILILTLDVMFFATDVFNGYVQMLIIMISLPIFAMNLDDYLKYRKDEKYDKY